MKVLYDYQAFTIQRYGGVSNCFAQLIKNLPSFVEYEVGVCESDNAHLKDSHITNVPEMKDYYDTFLSKKEFRFQSQLYAIYSRLFPHMTSVGRNRLCSISALKNGNYDVFHPTFFKPYFLKYLPEDKPFVLTVHDMIPELFFKKNDQQALNKIRLCKKAAHIVAVSENTKRDLIQMLHIPDNKITVIYHGAPSESYNLSSSPIVLGRYLLYVGCRDNYKSFILMLKALLPVLRRHHDIKILCTGPEFTLDERSVIKSFGIVDRVVHKSVNNSELMNLYAHAICFIYPSQYEGFGIPILESYAAHCPVMLNHASCFPEIAEDAAIYFNLDDSSSDLEMVMESFLLMEMKQKEELIERQLQRLKEFSWKKSAEQLADVYSKVVNK